jgi:hypothetical protein
MGVLFLWDVFIISLFGFFSFIYLFNKKFSQLVYPPFGVWVGFWDARKLIRYDSVPSVGDGRGGVSEVRLYWGFVSFIRRVFVGNNEFHLSPLY